MAYNPLNNLAAELEQLNKELLANINQLVQQRKRDMPHYFKKLTFQYCKKKMR